MASSPPAGAAAAVIDDGTVAANIHPDDHDDPIVS